MASYDEYYRANLENGQQRIDEENEATKKRNEELMRQIGEAIDQSAAAQENTYQQSIDKAPSKYQKLYDANTISELIGRRQLQESMANMGLTDSGLSRTQDTALTVQRQNADAAVRADQAEYVNKLKSAIDTVRANAAAQKAEKQIAMDTERDSWYRQAIAQMQSDAQSAAAKAYEADQDYAAREYEANRSYAAEAYKAQQEAAAAVEKARYEAIKEQSKAGTTAQTNYDKNRLAYAQSLMRNSNYTEEDAWAAAVARYPYSGDEYTQTNSYNKAYNDAKNSGYTAEYAKVYANAEASGEDGKDAVEAYKCQKAIGAVKNKEITLGWWDSVFHNGNFDTVKAAADKLVGGEEYAALSDEEKRLASAYLVGSQLRKANGGGALTQIGKKYTGLEKRVAYAGAGVGYSE